MTAEIGIYRETARQVLSVKLNPTETPRGYVRFYINRRGLRVYIYGRKIHADIIMETSIAAGGNKSTGKHIQRGARQKRRPLEYNFPVRRTIARNC